MLLSYLTIFCPSLGTDEESLANQLLFYTDASSTSTLDLQLRSIGLIQGILELGNSFAPVSRLPASHRPLRCIRSERTMTVATEMEPGIWCCLCVDLPAQDEKAASQSDMMPHPLQIQCQLHAAHELFCARYGTLTSLVQPDKHDQVLEQRKEAIRKLEKYWLRWAWRWQPRPVGVEMVYHHLASAWVNKMPARQQVTALQEYDQRLPDVASAMVLKDGLGVFSSSGLALHARRVLQQYVVDLLRDQEKRQSHIASSELTSTATDTAEGREGKSSWLSGKAWADSTRSMLTTFRSVSLTQHDAADTQNSDIDAEQGTWLFKDDTHIIWLPRNGVDRIWQQHRVQIWQHDDIVLILVLDVDTEVPAIAHESKSLMGLYHVLQGQGSVANAEPKASIAPSTFFSLLYDGVHGTVCSTLPDIDAALEEDAQDSPQQVLVKRNTIHLHQSLYTAYANLQMQGSKQGSQHDYRQLIRTSRNIWIVLTRQGEYQVMLCKSASSGDTAEAIYRAASIEMRLMERQ